jgi:hypothetical protein
LTGESPSERSERGGRSALVLVIALLFGLIAVGAAASLTYFLLFNLLSNPDRTAADLGRLETAAFQILLFSIAVGIIAMAVLEVLKRLTPIRALYHLWTLSNHLGRGPAEFLGDVVSHGRRRTAPFDLPIEQLTAQLGAALDQITSSVITLPIVWDPVNESGLFSEVPSPLTQSRFDLINAVAGRPFFVFHSSPSTPSGDGPSTTSKDGADPQRDMEGVLRAALDSGLDNLQLSIGSGWKRLVRLSAAIISAIAALTVSVLNNVSVTAMLVSVVGAFILGGFFAWLSRDIVAVLERWRQ